MFRTGIHALACTLVAASALAQAPPGGQAGDAAATRLNEWQPLLLGYSSEPGMEFGGRTLASAQSAASRAFASIADVGRRHPALAPAWEFPVAAALMLVQHEVDGHGGRAREFGLGANYSFGADFSATTTIARPPSTNEQGSLLAAGGTEADGVMAHAVLLDMLLPEGADGARVPLAIIAKLDLTVYVATTHSPSSSGFVSDFRSGNDVASWLVSRQADRIGADPSRVWGNTYQPNVRDPLLERDWRAARSAALWNLLDPSLVAAAVAYVQQHLQAGSVSVHAPMLRLADGVGFTVGTRAALGPREVTRFLDLLAATDRGVLAVYVRDLDSPVDRTWGFGAALHGVCLGRGARAGAVADLWEEPRQVAGGERVSGWNAAGELDATLSRRWGVAVKAGRKSLGFFPGLPLPAGTYAGLGLTFAW